MGLLIYWIVFNLIHSSTHACFISTNIYWVPDTELDICDLKMSEMLIMPVMSSEFSGGGGSRHKNMQFWNNKMSSVIVQGIVDHWWWQE